MKVRSDQGPSKGGKRVAGTPGLAMYNVNARGGPPDPGPFEVITASIHEPCQSGLMIAAFTEGALSGKLNTSGLPLP